MTQLPTLGGLAEVARIVRRSPSVVCNWVSRGSHGVPSPLAHASMGDIHPLDQWREWATANPALCGPKEHS